MWEYDSIEAARQLVSLYEQALDKGLGEEWLTHYEKYGINRRKAIEEAYELLENA